MSQRHHGSSETPQHTSSTQRLQSEKRCKGKRRPLANLNIRKNQHLAYQLGCEVDELKKYARRPSRYYRHGTFTSNGKQRPKTVPASPRFKTILKRLNRLLQRLDLPTEIHGGREGKSARTNARQHVNKPLLLKLDIEDFFPSVAREQVREAFARKGCTSEIADLLARITTPDECLPQGSPPSPVIAAMVTEPLVLRLRGLARQHGAALGQYIDDACLSGPEHLKKLKPLAIRIIESEGFAVHPRKRETLTADEEQTVTGLKVNRGLDVPREKLNEAKQMIEDFRYKTPEAAEVRSLVGKIDHMRPLNKGAAKQLRSRLNRCLKRHHGVSIEQVV